MILKYHNAVRNLATQSTAALVVGAATFGLQILMARQFGPETFSVYGIAMSVSGIAFIFQDGGFRALLYREATHPTPGLPPPYNLLSRALGWNLLMSAGLTLFAIGSAAMTGITTAAAVTLLILTNTGRIITLDISSLLRADGRFARDARWQVGNRVTVGLLMLLALLVADELIVVLVAGAVAQAAMLVLPTVRERLRRPALQLGDQVFRTCATLSAIDLITALYFRSDVVMLAALGRSGSEIGIYAAQTRIVEAYIFMVAPIAMLLFRFARLRVDDRRATARIMWFLITLLLLPSLGLLIITLVYREPIVQLIFGMQYVSGAEYLPWLIAACCAAAPNALLGQLLLASNRESYFLAAVIGALAVNLSFNAVLIPLSGAAGAAQATFVTEFGLSLFLIVALYAPIGANRRATS